MSDTADEYQGLPNDKILLAGLAFSVFGLTNVLTIVGWILKQRSMVSTTLLGLGIGFLSILPAYGLASGSIKRRSLIGLGVVLSWLSFFQEGNISLLGGGGLLVCIGLVTYDGVRQDRLGIGVLFMQSGAVMVLVLLAAFSYTFFQGGVLPWWGIWVLWKWSTFVLPIGGFALWLISLTYNSPYLKINTDSV